MIYNLSSCFGTPAVFYTMMYTVDNVGKNKINIFIHWRMYDTIVSQQFLP